MKTLTSLILALCALFPSVAFSQPTENQHSGGHATTTATKPPTDVRELKLSRFTCRRIRDGNVVVMQVDSDWGLFNLDEAFECMTKLMFGGPGVTSIAPTTGDQSSNADKTSYEGTECEKLGAATRYSWTLPIMPTDRTVFLCYIKLASL